MRTFIRENGGVLTVLGVAVLILAGYVEWRISENVFRAVHAQQLAKAADVTDLRADLEGDINELKAANNKLDGKIDQIITILITEAE